MFPRLGVYKGVLYAVPCGVGVHLVRRWGEDNVAVRVIFS
jgi:hypothetical protein